MEQRNDLQPTSYQDYNGRLNHRLTILGIIIIGTLLRLSFAHNRHFVADELGTLLWVQKDYHFLLTHFNSHWLTMNFYIAFLKFIDHLGGGSAWPLTIPSLIAGIALIPIVYQLGLEVGVSRETAATASFLIAVNPFLIKYSAIIRSYSLMLLFATSALLLFVSWRQHKTWAKGTLCAVSLLLALLTHANSIYQGVFIGILFILTVNQKDKNNITIILPIIAAAIITIYLYFPLINQILVYKQKFSQPAPAPINYLPELTWRFWGGGFYEVPSLLFLGFGIWFSHKKDDNRLSLFVLGIITPIFLSSMAGVSVSKYAMGRFLITILPIIILFISEGICIISSHTTHPRFIAIFLTLTIFLTWLPHANQVFNRQRARPWHKIIVYLNKKLSENDRVLPLARRAKFNLSFRALPEHVAQSKFLGINQLVNETSGKGKRLRVLAISDIAINGKKTIYQAGRLRVLSYTGAPKVIAKSILIDIKTALQDRISTIYVPYYRTTIQLLSAMSLDNELPKYISLYYESQLIRFSGSNPLARRRNYYLQHHKMMDFDILKNTFPIKF